MTQEEYVIKRRAIVNKSQAKRRARAMSLGLCSICCNNKPEPGYVTCRDCRLRITTAQRRRRHGED